ncbi:hypothetical protein Tco_1255642 [Tanacetum coccineum]
MLSSRSSFDFSVDSWFGVSVLMHLISIEQGNFLLSSNCVMKGEICSFFSCKMSLLVLELSARQSIAQHIIALEERQLNSEIVSSLFLNADKFWDRIRNAVVVKVLETGNFIGEQEMSQFVVNSDLSDSSVLIQCGHKRTTARLCVKWLLSLSLLIFGVKVEPMSKFDSESKNLHNSLLSSKYCASVSRSSTAIPLVIAQPNFPSSRASKIFWVLLMKDEKANKQNAGKSDFRRIERPYWQYKALVLRDSILYFRIPVINMSSVLAFPNGKLIYNSIMNGPYVRRMIPEPSDPARTVPVPKTFHEQTDNELTKAEIKQMEADDQAIQTIISQMMKGSDWEIQEKKAKLFNEWERFTSLIEDFRL